MCVCVCLRARVCVCVCVCVGGGGLSVSVSVCGERYLGGCSEGTREVRGGKGAEGDFTIARWTC